MTSHTALAASPPDEETILVLQGGGALGAYQAGVYEAMYQKIGRAHV